MVHQISIGYGRASATDVLIRAAQTQQTKDQMNRILSHLTKQPLDLVLPTRVLLLIAQSQGPVLYFSREWRIE
jgi:hypothetical protein